MKKAERRPLGEKIEAAWSDRWSQRIDAAIRAYPELRVELGLPLWGVSDIEVFSPDLKGPPGVEEALQQTDVILLQASIYRAKGQLPEAERLQAAAAQLLLSAGLPGSFRLHFERGLLHLVQGRYLTALEEFFSASRSTENRLFKILSLTNALLCMENSGISDSGTSRELERLRAKSLAKFPVYRANENQLRAYRMRKVFRLGRPAEALAEVAGFDDVLTALDQSRFYSLWLRLLPFHRAHRELSAEEASLLVSHPHALFQRGYLIRSLLGHTHTDDQNFVKLSERVDRAYLWTWKWIVSPESFSSERLMTSVNEVLLHLDLNALTLEDRYMLRNTLGWLGLADPSFREKTRTISRKLETPASDDFAIFEFEWALIQLLSARAQSKRLVTEDTLRYLERSTVYASSEILLSQMVKALRGDRDAQETDLGRAALRFVREEGSEGSASLVVDMNAHTLENARTGRTTVSQPMAVALYLLKRDGKVSCEDLAREAFGLYSYDSIVHASKIFNLVARLRASLDGAVSFRVKAGWILAEGSWERVAFREMSELSRRLRGESLGMAVQAPRDIGRSEAVPPIALLLRDHSSRGSFDRMDAEKTLAVSRSTTARILEKLVKSGRLERQGAGRATIYRFKFSPPKAELC